MADEKVNEDAFGRPGASRGSSAYPQIRFVSLVENGTHVLFGSQSERDWRRKTNGIVVRVIDYQLEGVEGAGPFIDCILDHAQAPARELAALYHERWEIETALDELKTHLRSGRVLAQQDSRLGPAGVLRLAEGSLCHSRVNARGRAQG